MIDRPDLDVLEELCGELGFAGTAYEFDVTEAVVIGWLRAYGVEEEERARGRVHGGGADCRLKEATAVAQAQYPRAGDWICLSEAAEQLGCSTSALHGRLRRLRERRAPTPRYLIHKRKGVIAALDVDMLR